MKQVTQTKRSTLMKSGEEAQAYTAWIADLRSRNSLLNWLSTDLYEREGKAQTNFYLTMPSDDCDLARQLVKDPQKFEVFGLSEEYSEKELKAAIVANIESTLPKTFLVTFLRESPPQTCRFLLYYSHVLRHKSPCMPPKNRLPSISRTRPSGRLRAANAPVRWR